MDEFQEILAFLLIFNASNEIITKQDRDNLAWFHNRISMKKKVLVHFNIPQQYAKCLKL